MGCRRHCPVPATCWRSKAWGYPLPCNLWVQGRLQLARRRPLGLEPNDLANHSWESRIRIGVQSGQVLAGPRWPIFADACTGHQLWQHSRASKLGTFSECFLGMLGGFVVGPWDSRCSNKCAAKVFTCAVGIVVPDKPHPLVSLVISESLE